MRALKEETIFAYTEGDCWFLAQELRRFTGGALVFSSPNLRLKSFPLSDAIFRWEHVALQLADGRIMDVYGPQSLDEFRDRWATEQLIVTDDETRIADLLEGQMPQYTTQPQTRALARRLLNAYRIPFTGRKNRDAAELSGVLSAPQSV